MVAWREVPVTDDRAQALLSEYFASRASSFPADQGEYRVVFPVPEEFEPPAGLFVVVEADSPEPIGVGGAVGCGGIRRLSPEPGGVVRYEVKHLWLQPHARGRGSGRLLLAELERRARTFGATELVLDTNSSLPAAGGLYVTSGFVEVEPYNDNPNADHWYAKAL